MSGMYGAFDEDPCNINVNKTVVNPLTGYNVNDLQHGDYDLPIQHVFEWINLILLCIFTPAFIFVAYQGYKLNKEVTFEVAVMLIAVFYNAVIGVATFIYCDDFMVICCEVTSSGILLYMFYRFQQIAFILADEDSDELMQRLEQRKKSMAEDGKKEQLIEEDKNQTNFADDDSDYGDHKSHHSAKSRTSAKADFSINKRTSSYTLLDSKENN